MTSSIQSPTDIANLALQRIGHQSRIGNLYDGSGAAKKVLTIYCQTRDELLREQEWSCSEKTAPLVLIKSAPSSGYVPPNLWTSDFPALPWRFEYAYPSDCIKVRSIKQASIFYPNFDPRPNTFRVASDVIYSVEDAQVYNKGGGYPSGIIEIGINVTSGMIVPMVATALTENSLSGYQITDIISIINPGLYTEPFPTLHAGGLYVADVTAESGSGSSLILYANSQARVILTNVADAIATYSAQIIDPTAWDPSFIEAFVASLARRLTTTLGASDQGKDSVEKLEGADEQASVMMGAMIQG